MSKEREVEICNIEGSIKGWGKKKLLKPSPDKNVSRERERV